MKETPISSMKKDPQNCPICEAEEKGVSSGYGMSPEGLREISRRHYEEHCDKCEKCGQPITLTPTSR